ncbi:MAG TPA: BlaI/MecI/CopY family transcriptional regulator [Steroidobacteraceae bacterium]|nr:BlaI/MecI/CopY family transcriptional regulator [Steroidobacteraceae bacterium]
MTQPTLTKLELRIMQILWERGPSAVREILDEFPEKRRPAYTTVQTIVYRLEAKDALRRVRKISNAHIFEATLSRAASHSSLIDDFLAHFGGRTQPVMSHLIESGKLTLKDLKDAEARLKALAKEKKG